MATLHGTCFCGGVRFEVDETPDRVRFCHCQSCKKLAGGGSTANFRAASASIRIVDGEDLVQTYQPDDGSAKTFCRACGSNLFGGGWPDSEHCSVRITTIEEPIGDLPGMHMWTQSVSSWELLPDDGFPQFETRPG